MLEKQENSFALPRSRFVLLGASNLTLSLRLVTGLMQQRFGAPNEIFAAIGHGRAFSVPSQMLLRGLPGIADSGLWQQLAIMPSRPVYAMITDIGNDILYESPPERILRAMEWCIAQLQQQPAQIVVTDLPMRSIEQLSTQRYLFFRNLFYPSCKLTKDEVVRRAHIVHAGLTGLAERMRFELYEQDPAWFGLDGIHVHYWRRKAYYGDILTRFHPSESTGTGNESRLPNYWHKRPAFAFKTVLGHAIRHPQPSGWLADGSSVFKY